MISVPAWPPEPCPRCEGTGVELDRLAREVARLMTTLAEIRDLAAGLPPQDVARIADLARGALR